jgi:hypothetical protein
MAVSAAMATVHKEMHAATERENKDQWQCTDDMHLVLLPQEVPGDDKEDQQAQAVPEPQGTEKPRTTCFNHSNLQFDH